jgi:hypothetical protein
MWSSSARPSGGIASLTGAGRLMPSTSACMACGRVEMPVSDMRACTAAVIRLADSASPRSSACLIAMPMTGSVGLMTPDAMLVSSSPTTLRPASIFSLASAVRYCSRAMPCA